MERDSAVSPGSKEGSLPTTLPQQVEVTIHFHFVLVRVYSKHCVQFWASPVLKKTLTNWFSRYLHLDSWTLPRDMVLFLCVLKTTALVTAEKAFKGRTCCHSTDTLLQIKTHDRS